MHFIVKQRRNAPVVACHTYANVGAFDDEDGHTGVLAMSCVWTQPAR